MSYRRGGKPRATKQRQSGVEPPHSKWAQPFGYAQDKRAAAQQQTSARGNRVRVTSGPLRSLEGVIQRVKGQTRVIINVDMIRQAMAVEVDSAVLEPA